MFAVLEASDFFWIWCIVTIAVAILAGGKAAYGRFKPSDVARLRRLEAKVDLILRHLGLEYHEPATSGGLSAEVKALADNPANKLAAIRLYREQTGAGLAEAKEAVESYMDGRG